jgi:hypothetical protein
MSPAKMCSFASKTALWYSSFVIEEFFSLDPNCEVLSVIDPAESVGLNRIKSFFRAQIRKKHFPIIQFF